MRKKKYLTNYFRPSQFGFLKRKKKVFFLSKGKGKKRSFFFSKRLFRYHKVKTESEIRREEREKVKKRLLKLRILGLHLFKRKKKRSFSFIKKKKFKKKRHLSSLPFQTGGRSKAYNFVTKPKVKVKLQQKQVYRRFFSTWKQGLNKFIKKKNKLVLLKKTRKKISIKKKSFKTLTKQANIFAIKDAKKYTRKRVKMNLRARFRPLYTEAIKRKHYIFSGRRKIKRKIFKVSLFKVFKKLFFYRKLVKNSLLFFKRRTALRIASRFRKGGLWQHNLRKKYFYSVFLTKYLHKYLMARLKKRWKSLNRGPMTIADWMSAYKFFIPFLSHSPRF